MRLTVDMARGNNIDLAPGPPIEGNEVFASVVQPAQPAEGQAKSPAFKPVPAQQFEPAPGSEINKSAAESELQK